MLCKILSHLSRDRVIRFSEEFTLQQVPNSQSSFCSPFSFSSFLYLSPPQANDTRELLQGVFLTPASPHPTLSAQPGSFFLHLTESPSPLCSWATTDSAPHQPDGWPLRSRRDSRTGSCALSPTVGGPFCSWGSLELVALGHSCEQA